MLILYTEFGTVFIKNLCAKYGENMFILRKHGMIIVIEGKIFHSLSPPINGWKL
jgi:hypothetical protein